MTELTDSVASPEEFGATGPDEVDVVVLKKVVEYVPGELLIRRLVPMVAVLIVLASTLDEIAEYWMSLRALAVIGIDVLSKMQSDEQSMVKLALPPLVGPSVTLIVTVLPGAPLHGVGAAVAPPVVSDTAVTVPLTVAGQALRKSTIWKVKATVLPAAPFCVVADTLWMPQLDDAAACPDHPKATSRPTHIIRVASRYDPRRKVAAIMATPLGTSIAIPLNSSYKSPHRV
jgi:hypothetical protein